VRKVQVRKNSKAAILLLCAGVTGTVCFVTLIAIHVITGWQEEAYFASLPAFFEQPEHILDVETDPTVLAGNLPARAPGELAIDFKNEFTDAVAWIRINGTSVNYPIMHRSDNEYYLTRRPDGKASRSGSIFIDYRNAPDFSDQNTFIYGHRMRSGAMFGMLKDYASQSFYEKHQTVSIFTPKGNYSAVLFAGYVFNQIKEETPPMKFADAEALANYVRDAKRRSMFKSDIEVNFGDRLVTLCTCEYSYNEARLLVVGKLVAEDS